MPELNSVPCEEFRIKRQRPGISPALVSVFLLKASKHLAVLVCLLILAVASGRYRVSQTSIFSIVVVSAVLHLAGQASRRAFHSRYDCRTPQA